MEHANALGGTAGDVVAAVDGVEGLGLLFVVVVEADQLGQVPELGLPVDGAVVHCHLL